MRRGWHEDWDATERIVWTIVAVIWVAILAISPLMNVPWNFVQTWVSIHALVYGVMWLRRMFQANRR